MATSFSVDCRRYGWTLLLLLLLPFGCSSSAKPATKSGDGEMSDSPDSESRPSSDRMANANDDRETSTPDQPAAVEKEPSFPSTLAIGDLAPPIHLAEFYTGDAISEFKKGQIYVVEFWATWCPPCRTSMPHLSHLQEQYEDKVTVIGVTDEGQEKVGPFLAMNAQGEEDKIWADVVKYRLARDKNGWTSKSYMEPAKQSGIPTAFIVGSQGHIEWFGHPMEMDAPLEKIVNGKWDRKSAIALIAAKSEFQQASQNQDWEAALLALDKFADLTPDDTDIPITRFQILMQVERYQEAQVLAEEILAGDTPAAQLNPLAWFIATEVPEEKRDLDLALKIAQKANALTDENAAPVLDTLARVCFERGEWDDATKWQEKAVLYGDSPEYRETLERYRNEKDKPEIPESLVVGDVAPGVYVSQWYTGEPIASLESFTPDKVYVIEFWATWCPPCRTSMPHLSQLQEKYGDEVTFIGITKEGDDVVLPFLEKSAKGGEDATWAEVVKYRLAQDRSDWTRLSYMKAAQQSGIPTAFIVGQDGHLEWIGHPMEMDKPLEDIIRGEWDRDAAREKSERDANVKKVMMAAREGLSAAQKAEDWDAMLVIFSEMEEALGDDSDQLVSMKFSLLSRAKRFEDALKIAAEALEADTTESRLLNAFAWQIATGFPEEERDLALALKIAQHANAMTDEVDHQVIDTLARVYFERDEFDRAIEWQTKAVALGGEKYEDALKKYQAAAKESEQDAPKEAEGDASTADGGGETSAEAAQKEPAEEAESDSEEVLEI